MVRSRLPSDLFFVQNYWRSLRPHGWSLAVEEHFYLLLPLYLSLLARGQKEKPFRRLRADFAVFAVALLNLRIVSFCLSGAFDPGRFNYLHLFPSHLRMDSLACGVLIAYLRCYHAEVFAEWVQRWKFVLCIVGLALVSPAYIWPMQEQMATWGLASLYLGYGALLTVLIHMDRLPKACEFAGELGLFSYSIYLFHVDVFHWLERSALQHWPYGLRVFFEVSTEMGVGILLAKAIEIPALHLRDRYFPPRKPPEPPTPERERSS